MSFNVKITIIVLSILLLIGLLGVGYMQRKKIFKLLLANKTQSLEYSQDKLNNVLRYRFYMPKEINKPVPLVLYLHGAGQRGDNNSSQLDFVLYSLTSKRIQKNNPCFIVAPQCPSNKQWVNTSFKSLPYDHYVQDEIQESSEMILIKNLIDELSANYPIDTNRIYITGFSMGSSGTWDMITRYPDMFAAAIPMSGVSDTSKAYLLKNISIWAFHGAKDKIAPVRLNQEMVEAIRANGGNAQLTIFKNKSHGVSRKALSTRDLFKWLFEQKK